MSVHSSLESRAGSRSHALADANRFASSSKAAATHRGPYIASLARSCSLAQTFVLLKTLRIRPNCFQPVDRTLRIGPPSGTGRRNACYQSLLATRVTDPAIGRLGKERPLEGSTEGREHLPRDIWLGGDRWRARGQGWNRGVYDCRLDGPDGWRRRVGLELESGTCREGRMAGRGGS